MIADEEDQTEENQDEDSEGQEGAEGAEGEGGEGGDNFDGEPKKGNKKLIIIIGGVVVLLIVAGAGLYFTGMLDSLLGKTPECTEQLDEHGEPVMDEHGEPVIDCPEEEHGDDHASDGGGHDDGHGGGSGNFLAIPPMIVNLNTENGTPRYLRLTVQLEMNNAADVAAVEAVIPRVVDQFQTYLRELRVRDLRGSAGIYRLQMELLWRVNQAAAPVEVKDVLFQEILIQ